MNCGPQKLVCRCSHLVLGCWHRFGMQILHKLPSLNTAGTGCVYLQCIVLTAISLRTINHPRVPARNLFCGSELVLRVMMWR
jgi:hypothetical protein